MNKIDGIGRAGVVLNIVFSSLILICSALIFIPAALGIQQSSFFIFILVFIFLPQILTITFNVLYYKKSKFKVLAGIFGLLFSGLIGGIFVLVSEKNKYKEVVKEEQIEKVEN